MAAQQTTQHERWAVTVTLPTLERGETVPLVRLEDSVSNEKLNLAVRKRTRVSIFDQMA